MSGRKGEEAIVTLALYYVTISSLARKGGLNSHFKAVYFSAHKSRGFFSPPLSVTYRFVF